MSRQELAEAVNAWLFAKSGGERESHLDETYIGKLERGAHRWPTEQYRAALRGVLGATTDAELGLHITRSGRRSSTDDAAPVTGSAGLLLAHDTWDGARAAALASFLADDHDVGSDDALRLSHEWRIVDPPQMIEMAAGRRVGGRLATMVTERAETLRRMDDFLGGGDMHDLVARCPLRRSARDRARPR